MTPASIAEWMATFARYVPDRRPLAVLDLGSGTGRFTPATFEFLTEDEIEAGFAAFDAAVVQDVVGAPVEGTSDLLVLG